MVSKVAVIALVAIVACPILLGYAMNLQEVNETVYVSNEDSVNVTPLLQNGVAYTYSNADYYTLNSNFGQSGYTNIYPYYESLTAAKSALPMTRSNYAAGVHPYWGGAAGIALSNWGYLFYQSNNGTSGGYVVGNYCDPDGTLIQQIPRLHTIFYDPQTMTIKYTYYTTIGSTEVLAGTINVPDPSYRFGMTNTGGYVANGFAEYILSGTDPDYVDLSAGFHFEGKPSSWWIRVPQYSRNVLLTIDLDSVSDPTYSFRIVTSFGGITIEKSTSIGGVVTWQFYPTANPIAARPIYYDQDSSNNVYQLKFDLMKTKQDSTYKYYDETVEFRYIGAWPNYIGYSNYYQIYTYETEIQTALSFPDLEIGYVAVAEASNDVSPKMRVDAAEFRAFEYQTIENQTYKPADFKTNPYTKIENIAIYGKSITFAGNTYNVDKGNIRIGSHDIPVEGLIFSSVRTDSGYENRIGNTAVSTTLTPATLTFNGQWSASISTASSQQTTVTKTEWTPGQFGWDGIDQNFLMVGLLTSIGVFIALGIYIRRTKAALWPLLIVCGGAAMLFFCML